MGLTVILSEYPSCRFLMDPGGTSESGPGLIRRVGSEELMPMAFDHKDALASEILCSLFAVPQLISIEYNEIVKPVSAFQISM